jgi:hypothetical protein
MAGRKVSPAPWYRRRAWWTRERVMEGLRRFHRNTGEAPTCSDAYSALTGPADKGKVEAGRRYPSGYAVLSLWPTMADAWLEAGVEPRGRLSVLPAGAAARLGGRRYRDRTGERYGLSRPRRSSASAGESPATFPWRCGDAAATAGASGSPTPSTCCA